MDIVLLIIGIILVFAGLAGCFIPGLPGPPLSFLALICMLFVKNNFSAEFYFFWAAVSLVVIVFDYYLPVWFAKKFGASRTGIIGGILGMIIGIFFTPVGMVLGLIIGSILGDLLSGKNFRAAIKSGLGGALGTLMTIGIKLIASGWMSWYFFESILSYFRS
jgi:uncharacterized protein